MLSKSCVKSIYLLHLLHNQSFKFKIMKKETMNEVKKNVTTGASSTIGAAAGVIIGTIVSPTETQAQEVNSTTPSSQETQTSSEQNNTTSSSQENQIPSEQEPLTPPVPEPEIEVIGYDRVTNEDGSQMDIAVLDVDGNEIGVVDVNIDGEADAFICDVNHNGVIEEGEMQVVRGEGIEMQPLQEAAGFDPLYAQNDLPDYVNDANTDTYMA